MRRCRATGGGSGLRLVLALAIVTASLMILPAAAWATPEFASQTGKACDYCHSTPGGPLNAEGQAFKDNGFVLPAATPTSTVAGASSTTAPESPLTSVAPPGTGSGAGSSGPLVPLARWLRTLLLWLHLVGVVAWLGAIIFVHVVQTPRVAGRGIPRGYFKLAWPSIALAGASGVILTLGDVSRLGALTEGRWGTVLLIKIAIYLFLVAVAFLATFVLSPRLRRLGVQAEVGSDHQRLREQGRVTVGYNGCVYDVTDSHLWRQGRHAKRHEAWTDLTASLGGAPHGPEVFERFPVVAGKEPGFVPPVARLFVVIAYVNLGMVLGVLLAVAAW